MREVRLPLSALVQARIDAIGRRVVQFGRHHGHAPDDRSTWAEWCAVTPELRGRLVDVACVLPLVYPICRPVRPTIAADLRVLAVRGRWPERTHAQLALTPRESPYFGDGLQALRTAWRKLDGQQQLSAARRYGPVLLTLLERDPTPAELAQVEGAMPGGCVRGDAGLLWGAVAGAEQWRVSTPYRAWPAGWLT